LTSLSSAFGSSDVRYLNQFNYTKMILREAEISDIKQIEIVRNSVTENTLSGPGLVTDEDCEELYVIK